MFFNMKKEDISNRNNILHCWSKQENVCDRTDCLLEQQIHDVRKVDFSFLDFIPSKITKED